MLIVVLANKFVRFTSGRKCLLIPNQFNKSPPTFCLCKSMNKIWKAFHCSLKFFAKKQSQTNAIKFLLVLIFLRADSSEKCQKRVFFKASYSSFDIRLLRYSSSYEGRSPYIKNICFGPIFSR